MIERGDYHDNERDQMTRSSPDTVELLPCPFCGASDLDNVTVSDESPLGTHDVIRCLQCYGEAPEECWNSRAAIEEIENHVKACTAQIFEMERRAKHRAPAQALPGRTQIAAFLAKKWPGDYAEGDPVTGPNALAFETADVVIAALPGEPHACTTCCGSGYSNHPDSNEICHACAGQGATPASLPQTPPETAEEIARKILPCICSTNPMADCHTVRCPGNFRKAVAKALAAPRAQSSSQHQQGE